MFFLKCFYLEDCEYEIHLISCNSIVVGGVCYKLKFTRQVVRAGPAMYLYIGDLRHQHHFWAHPSQHFRLRLLLAGSQPGGLQLPQ